MPTYGTNNASDILRVTSSWTQPTLSWNNQPSNTSIHKATLSQSTSVSQDYININIADMVADMKKYGNYGMLLRHAQETAYYNSMIFHSSDALDSTQHPRLSIVYHMPPVAVNNLSSELNVFKIYPNPAKGVATIGIQKQYSGAVNIIVTDILGKIVLNETIINSLQQFDYTLDSRQQLNGVYNVQVQFANGYIQNEKLVFY